MIEKFSIGNETEYYFLLEFLNKYNDYDFYFSENNARIFITDVKSLKRMIKKCYCCYIIKINGDYKGVILVISNNDINKQRFYVKLVAENNKIATDLLTIISWNCNKELFAKIRQNNRFMNSFKSKGFRFIDSKGVQVLLNRKYVPYELKINRKEE